LSLLVLLIATARGSRAALWVGFPIGMLLMHAGILYKVPGGFPLTSQTATMLSLLLGLVVGGSIGPLSRLRWTLADTVLVVMALGQCASNVLNNKNSTLTIPATLCYTIPPYLFGRWYLRSWEDVSKALRPLAVCLMLLSMSIVIESVTGINIIRALGGRLRTTGVRMGVTRASGCLGHPITMGLTLVTLMPWALVAAQRAREGTGPSWWRLLPWAMGAAIMGTVSRGPMSAMVILLAVYTFFRRPRWRVPLLCAAVVAGLAFTVAFDQIKSVLYFISGESKSATTVITYIYIDNREFIYTGTDHRWLLFQVYAEPLRNAGLFGYGFGGFEGAEDAMNVIAHFRSIDNNIVVYILAYGYGGLTLFLLLAILPLWPLGKVALDRRNPFSQLAAGVFGAVVAFHLALITVGLSRDYQMFCMLLGGFAVTVAQLGRQWRPAPPVARVPAPASTGPAPVPPAAPGFAPR
jgi:hypothetical protein